MSEKEKNSEETDVLSEGEEEISEDNQVNQEEIKEKVKDYVKIDDLLREKMAEIKKLKDQRKMPEEKIKKFLKKSDLDYIKIDNDNDKIIKEEVEKKSAVKNEMISDSIKETLKEEKIYDTDDKCIELCDKIMKKLEKKRLVVKSVNIKREKKNKKEKPEKPKKKNK